MTDKGNARRDFSDRVSDLITDSGKTLRDIYEKTGIPPSSLSGYQKYDGKEPRLTAIVKLADYFGVTTDYLLGRTESSSITLDARAACDYSGLSDTAINRLHEIKTAPAFLNPAFSQTMAVNALLEQDTGHKILEEISLYLFGNCNAFLDNDRNPQEKISICNKDNPQMGYIANAEDLNTIFLMKVQELLIELRKTTQKGEQGNGKH